MSMLEQLQQLAPQISPTACKLASMGHLDKLVGDEYGFETLTEKEASIIVGTQYEQAARRVKEAFELVEDISTALEGTTIKLAEHVICPEGVIPEAWNLMRVEKAARLLEIADLYDQLGETKHAANILAAHEKIACLAFDYFKEYGEKLAADFSATIKVASANKEANAGFLQSAKETMKNVLQNQKVKEYGGTALKGLLGGGAAAAGAMPIISHFGKDMADDVMSNARDKAIQTAAGVGGVTVGANQLNNLLSSFTKGAAESCDSKEDEKDTERKPSPDEQEDTDLHPLSKMALHFLLDEYIEDPTAKRQNKVAWVHAMYDFCERETPIFEKQANMFNPSSYQSNQGMATQEVQTPQYPMGASGTPMAGDSASAIGNAAASTGQ